MSPSSRSATRASDDAVSSRRAHTSYGPATRSSKRARPSRSVVAVASVVGPLPSLISTAAPATGAPPAITRTDACAFRASMIRGGGSPVRHATSAANTLGPASTSLPLAVPAGSRNAPSPSLVARRSPRVTSTFAIGCPAPSTIHPATGSGAIAVAMVAAGFAIAVVVGVTGIAIVAVSCGASRVVRTTPASRHASGAIAATIAQRRTASIDLPD